MEHGTRAVHVGSETRREWTEEARGSRVCSPGLGLCHADNGSIQFFFHLKKHIEDQLGLLLWGQISQATGLDLVPIKTPLPSLPAPGPL